MTNFTMYDIFMGTNGYPGPGMMKTVPTLMEMTEGGIRVDQVEAGKWCRELIDNLEVVEKDWAKSFAPINASSNQQVAKLLYNEWGLPVQRSKEDGITVDELACINLKQLVIDRPKLKVTPPWQNDPRCTPEMFDLLLKVRTIGKDLSTYADVVVHGDGRVHPGYLPESKDSETRDGKKRKGIAATGRLASRGPNIQNQPKSARRIFIADSGAFTFVQHDYKAAELYVWAYYSGDKVLLDDLMSGDIHSRNAKRFNCSRDTAKNIIYAISYGAGPNKMSDMLKLQNNIFVDADECKRIMDGIAQVYHVMWAKRQVVAAMCVNLGYVINPFGRIRWYYNGSNDITSAYDYVPQSTVADVLLCILKEMNDFAKSLGGRLTTTVHDSTLGQVPNAMVKDYVEGGKKIMQRTFDNVAPGFFIPVESEIGTPGGSWGALKKAA